MTKPVIAALPADPEERLVALVHALRTPLTQLSGFADLLETRGESLSVEQHTELVEKLAAGVREMGAILDAEYADRRGR